MHTVELADETFARLQAYAVPLVDTIESVINRALDALDTGSKAQPPQVSGFRPFNPDAPPDLSFTTVKSVTIEGVRLGSNETYWNSAMLALVRLAKKRGMSAQQIGAELLVNNVVGQKEDGGYKYVEEAGLSVQGQDANAAWRAARHLASAIDVSLEITFAWQHNPKAAFSGEAGRFVVKSNT
jgi:hypothetical protein